ncbi:MAG: flavin reductase [Anaerolineaceae bacterium]|nr:flavin reductase [Anaerolineaceae bacterium]
MNLSEISINAFRIRSYQLFEKQWLLLTSGDFQKGTYNAMSIGWGSIGSMWSKPFVQIVVRPSRYTYEFLNTYPTFTVTAFPEQYRKTLVLLGSKSGRDGDKILESGLTPIASQHVAAPGYAEANLIIECEKMYWDDMKPKNFLNEDILQKYPEKDYHRSYYGEIKSIIGDASLYAS